MMIIGTILGFFIATVGLNGAIVALERGIAAMKEYVPSAENQIESIKKWSVDTVK